MKHANSSAVLQLICRHQHPVTQNHYDEYKLLSVQKWEITQNVVLLRELIFDEATPLIIEWQHDGLTSLLDVTGCVPYELWYFDQNKKFTGKAFSLGNASGNYMIQTQARYVLLWNRTKTPKTTQYLADFNCIAMDWEGEGKFNFTHQNFGHHYGRFPYLIIPVQSVCFTQIPISSNTTEKHFPGLIIRNCWNDKELVEKHLLEVSQQYYDRLKRNNHNQIRMVLVLSPTKAHYFEPDGSIVASTEIPTGGILIDCNKNTIAKNALHYVQPIINTF